MKTAWALALSGVICAGTITAGIHTNDAAAPATAGDAVSSGEPQAQARLVGDFAGFAGSDANARSLVAGLRQASEVTLTASNTGGRPGSATRFFPPTRAMDYSNVRIALVLAREQLAQLGITRPTPAQLKTALAGGGIANHANGQVATPFLLPGVLQMRASGMGWQKIAGTMGITLAQAMNKTYQADFAASPNSRRPATVGAADGARPAAFAGIDTPTLRRAGAAPAPISSVSITKSVAGGPRAAAVKRPATPARRSVPDLPKQTRRHSEASVVAAAVSVERAGSVAIPVQEHAPGEAATTTVTVPVVTGEPAGYEERQAVEE